MEIIITLHSTTQHYSQIKAMNIFKFLPMTSSVAVPPTVQPEPPGGEIVVRSGASVSLECRSGVVGSMIFALGSQFYVYLPWVNTHLA